MTTTAYEPRKTDMIGISVRRGWRMKDYVITASASPLAPEVITAANELLDERLPPADVSPALGFSILHRGKEAIWLLADLWRGDILYQRLYSTELDAPLRFELVEAEGPMACVWELAVHSHERDAFIAYILSRPSAPDVDGYLATSLSIEAVGR
jgi:hypothetical protein